LGFSVALAGVALCAALELPERASGVVLAMGRWLCWCTAPLLFGVASAPSARDRREGIDALVMLRGARASELVAARTLAAMTSTVLRIGVPAMLFCAGLASLGVPRIAAMHATSLALFALGSGTLLAGVASLCGETAGARGRELFLLAVVVPWVVASLSTEPAWSIPGMLELALGALVGGRA
jgi:hypothetical protein